MVQPVASMAFRAALTVLLALPCAGQSTSDPGKVLDIRERPKTPAEQAKAQKAKEQQRQRLESLKQARAAELAQAYAAEEQRQAALKAERAAKVGSLSFGASPAPAPSQPPTGVVPPVTQPRTAAELFAALQALASGRDALNRKRELVSFDGVTLVFQESGANFHRRFAIPFRTVVIRTSRQPDNEVHGADDRRPADAVRFDARNRDIQVDTRRDIGSPWEGTEDHAYLPVSNAEAAVDLLRRFQDQTAGSPEHRP